MLTNNYYTLRKMLATGFDAHSSLRPEDYRVRLVGGGWYGSGYDGNYNVYVPRTTDCSLIDRMARAFCQENYNYGYGHDQYNWMLSDRVGVYFGSGSTPATAEDYKLESPIASGLSITAGSIRMNKQSDGTTIYRNSYIVANTSDADIVIGEVCITGLVHAPTYYFPAALERTAFASPVTLSPGESKLVTYTVTVPPM